MKRPCEDADDGADGEGPPRTSVPRLDGDTDVHSVPLSLLSL